MFIVRSHTRSPARSSTSALALSELGAPRLHTHTFSSVRTGPRGLPVPPGLAAGNDRRCDDCTGEGVQVFGHWCESEGRAALKFTSGTADREDAVAESAFSRSLATGSRQSMWRNSGRMPFYQWTRTSVSAFRPILRCSASNKWQTRFWMVPYNDPLHCRLVRVAEAAV